MRMDGIDQNEWYGWEGMVWMRRDGMDEKGWYGTEWMVWIRRDGMDGKRYGCDGMLMQRDGMDARDMDTKGVVLVQRNEYGWEGMEWMGIDMDEKR